MKVLTRHHLANYAPPSSHMGPVIPATLTTVATLGLSSALCFVGLAIAQWANWPAALSSRSLGITGAVWMFGLACGIMALYTESHTGDMYPGYLAMTGCLICGLLVFSELCMLWFSSTKTGVNLGDYVGAVSATTLTGFWAVRCLRITRYATSGTSVLRSRGTGGMWVIYVLVLVLIVIGIVGGVATFTHGFGTWLSGQSGPDMTHL